MNITRKLNAYERLMRLDKPIGILLLLWPTLWGLMIAGKGQPGWVIVLVFVTGTILMRSAGCVMNDIADRNFDGHVERTKQRPLVQGEVTVKEACFLAAILSLSAFLIVIFLNKMTIILSIVALFLALTYPLTKRFLAIPQAYLGIAFGFGIPMGFSAINNNIPTVAWLLLLTNIFWAVAYDTVYAMIDRDDDFKIGVKSSALFFGQYDVSAVIFCYLAMLSILIYVGQLIHFGLYYTASLFLTFGLVIWQYQLIKKRTKTGCFSAFTHSHWIGFLILLGIAVEYYADQLISLFPIR